MAGKRIIVIERRTYTFSGLAASQSQTTVIERAFDVSGHKEATLQVAMHSQTMSAGQSLNVTATPVQLVDSEPTTDFLASTAAATASASTSPSTNGKLIPANLTAGFGSHVQIAITGTQPASASALACTITVLMILKE
jgi:hypothetical protein